MDNDEPRSLYRSGITWLAEAIVGEAPGAVPGQIVWQGTIPYGDGERPDVEARVRRLDDHALLAEVRLRASPPGSPAWEAPDDDVAARAYEQALLELLRPRPAVPRPPPEGGPTDAEVCRAVADILTDGGDGAREPFMGGSAGIVTFPREEVVPLQRDLTGLPHGSKGFLILLPGGREWTVAVVRSR